MGGKAFGEGVAQRIPKDVYDEACIDIQAELHEILDYYDDYHDAVADWTIVDIGVPKSIHNKTDYGDIDILIGAARPHNFFEELQLCFGENMLQYSKNGAVSSMLLLFQGYKIQVDFIFVPPDQYHSALNYFSFNDLGCLLGVMARKNDMKLGFDGLSYRMSAVEHGCNLEPMLTNNWFEMLNYFGLDILKYKRGFDSLEDMFKFIISCRFFNPKLFQFEELNHINRLRNRKRITYQKFVDWVNLRHFPEVFQPHDNHEMRFAEINKAFPDSLLTIERWRWKEEKGKEELIRSKFNGTLIMEWTGLTGKSLGDFISRLKDSPEYTRIGLFGTLKEAEDLVKALPRKET